MMENLMNPAWLLLMLIVIGVVVALFAAAHKEAKREDEEMDIVRSLVDSLPKAHNGTTEYINTKK